MKKRLLSHGIALSLLAANLAHASGMLPETSVVIVNEADGEGVINVKNTDPTPSLLYTAIEDIPEDTADLIVASPPVARVESGQSQLVRFILQSDKPLETERMKRVTFEGIPQKHEGASQVKVVIRQNLPLIIRPKHLAPDRQPWLHLQWSVTGEQLSVSNPSPYIVRLAQAVRVLPADREAALPKAYILPGEKITLTSDRSTASGALKVRLLPSTAYGYAAGSVEMPVNQTTPPAK